MPVDTEIAIVGAAVDLPGAPDLDRMARDLRLGSTHLMPVSDREAYAAGVDRAVVENDRYVPVGAPLDGAELFDRDFFGMTQAEAMWTDPQQRLLLRLTHDALESAAADPHAERVGVYASASASSYLRGRDANASQSLVAEVDYRSLLGNDRDFLATRIAYKLGCTGPAVTVQTACSSSLVAVHQACAALILDDADVVVTAAASLRFPQRSGYVHSSGGILSPTGRSRPFDADADGTVQGSGGGAVVLRRLDDARDRGDDILAVIAGTAVNNDGSQRMGYSAPSVAGQEAVLRTAIERAGIRGADVGYVEAHGTGTPIGDPIEFRALAHAYGGERSRLSHVGAAKANYGHLDVAAGMVGLLKTVLTVRERTVFGQPSFAAVNPGIPLTRSGFTVATDTVEVPDLRYAAVSSFGMGGTNAHVIVRRADERPPMERGRGPVTVALTARSQDGLEAFGRRVAEYLRYRTDIDVHDVAATLATRRRHDIAWTTSVGSTGELIARLDEIDTRAPSQQATVEPGEPHTPVGRRCWLPPTPLRRDPYLLPLVSAPRVPDDPPATAATAATAVKPRTGEVVAAFQRLVAEELGDDRVGPETDFFAAGGESVALVSIVGKLTKQIQFRVDFDQLDGVTRVGAMASVLAAQASAAPTTIPSPATPNTDAPNTAGLVRFGTDTPSAYLYPPAGGTNFCYGALHRLRPEHSLAAFRSVAHAESVEAIAAECVRRLRTSGVVSTGADANPLVLGGYSFGGNVAFEMARQLIDDHGVYPQRLVMIDSFAPHSFSERRTSPADLASDVRTMVDDLTSDDPTDDDPEVLSAFRRVWSSNTRALLSYRPAHAIPTPVTLLRAGAPLRDSYASALGVDRRRVAEWTRWTTGPVTVVDVPGDHYSVFTDRAHREVVADQFALALADVRPRPVHPASGGTR